MPEELNEEYREMMMSFPPSEFYAGIANRFAASLLAIQLDAEMIDDDCSDPNIQDLAEVIQPTARIIIELTDRLRFYVTTLIIYNRRQYNSAPPSDTNAP